MRTLNTVVVIIVYLKCIDSQTFPTNPCPNLFKYFQNNGYIFGRVVFPNDYSGKYTLSVNMSIATLLSDNQNIRLELKTSANEIRAGTDLIYDIHFPIQNILPKPTRIEFNEEVYCLGPQEELRPGRGITNMWASTYKGVSISSRPRPKPTRRPSTTQFIPPENQPVYFGDNYFLTFGPPSRPPTTTRRTTTTTTTTTTRRPTTDHETTSTTRPTTTTTTAAPESECGLSTNAQHLIINGDLVEEGQFPWMAAIMFQQEGNYTYGCSGSLVSNRHIVTAAHCVWWINAPLLPLENILVVLGEVDLANWDRRATSRNIETIRAHPNHKPRKGDGDIAVLKLKQPVKFQDSIRPVCLWQNSDDLNAVVERTGIVAGWGRDETGRNVVTEAKRVNLPIVSQITCLRSDPGFIDITSNRTFCAGNQDGSGPCSGDSGAGFVININGRWTLRGIVSTALRDTATCDVTKYFVFADVAKFKDWINNELN